MAIRKEAKNLFENRNLPAVPLNKPKGWDFFELPKVIKTASIQKSQGEDLGGFDIAAAVEEHPEHLFVKIFAIKQDEINDNGDYFSAKELKLAAETFIGVPIFTNHQNDDIEKARGKCVHAWYDADAEGIFIIASVDKVAYPKLARSIAEGYVSGCFPPDAPVLLADGTEKSICDIEDGDYVITHKGRPRRVLGTRQRGYKYPIYSISLEGIGQPLNCTSHHNLMVYRLPEECLCGCGVELPEKSDPRITKKRFNRKFAKGHNGRGQQIDYKYVQKIKACDLKDGDFLFEPKIIDDSKDHIVSEDEAFLIGLFLAEGSYEKRDGVRHSVIFNFGSEELETLAFNCSELLEKVFSNHSNLPTTNYYPEASSTRVNLYGKDVADWFYKQCGEYSDKKKLNPDLLSLGVEKTAALLAGYVEGDGYNVKGKVYGGATVSADLASQLRILFQKIGVRNCYRITDDPKRWGYKPVHEITSGITTAEKLKEHLLYKQANDPCYGPAAWHDLDDITLRKIISIDEIEYDGVVYDIEVEEDHTYCVNHVAVSNTSMGCSVDYSVCSVCHNMAHTADEYCSHVRGSKNRKVSGEYTCKYHESSTQPENDCPVCGCKKGATEKLVHSDLQVYEHNFGLKFIENSFVVNPACHSCGVECILHAPEITKKVASLKNQVANLVKIAETNSDEPNTKTAGTAELDILKSALTDLEKVAKSMMSQKDYVDMEYVSDLVKAMADVQGTIDELQEMGYAQVPSPPEINEAAAGMPDAEDTDVSSLAFPPPAQEPQVQQPPQTTQTGETVQTSLGDGIGSVTKPKLSETLLHKKKEFTKTSSKIMNRLAGLRALSQQLTEGLGSETMSDMVYDVWENKEDRNSRHVMIDGEFVSEAQGDDILRVSKISTLDEELQKLIAEEPQKAAEQILGNMIKESDTTMADKKQEKTAALGPNETDDASQGEVITEKQLQNHPDLHPRTGETYEQITESPEQLGRNDDKSNDTTSDSPQHRWGTYETITEDQLDAVTSGHLVRWKDAPEVITEKQWDEMSRLVSAKLPDDWTETITQDQLRNLLDSHSTAGTYETITEDQLDERLGGIKRWASTGYLKHLTKIARETLSDVLAHGKTLDEVKTAFAKLDDDSKLREKVAFLTVVNSLPQKAAARKEYAKTASAETDVLEALAMSAASHAGMGVRAEDIFAAMDKSTRRKEVMAKVEELTNQKVAAAAKANKLVDKHAALDRALDVMDGIQIKATAEEVGVDPKNKEEFVEAAKKLAKQMIEAEGYGDHGMVVLEIKLDPATGMLTIDAGEGEGDVDDLMLMDEMEGDVADIAEQDGMGDELGDELGDEVVDEDKDMGYMGMGNKPMAAPSSNPMYMAEGKEKTKEARAKQRKALTKEAQMMGGEMGGQGGVSQAPGAGASLPQSPALDAPPMESFGNPMDEGMGDDSGDLSAKPPGSVCPVCTSADVDIIAGKGHCNNCGSEMMFKVAIEVTKWADLVGDQDDGQNEEEPGLDGEGFDLPEADAGTEMPVAASSEKLQKIAETGLPFALTTKLAPEAVKKASEAGIEFGSVSPITGTRNTHKIASNSFVCLDSGTPYKVELAVSKKGGPAYAQWSWTPKTAEVCPSCRRQKEAFNKALEDAGLSKEKFEAMSLKDKAAAILELKKAGSLNLVKVASKQGSVLEDYKVAYGVYGDSFPIESCREKLARRYGKNALALSGPCEGQPIHDCVCDQLKSAGVYTDGLAIKVAEAWSDRDGSEECVEDQVREGLGIREAAIVCTALKNAFAQAEDFLADDLGYEEEMTDDLGDMEPVDEGPMDEDMDMDPFDTEMDAEMVTLELTKDLAEELDAALDVELGSDPTDDLEMGEDVGDPEVVGDDLLEEDLGDSDLGGEEDLSGGDEMMPMEHGKPCGHGMDKPMEEPKEMAPKHHNLSGMDKGDDCGCGSEEGNSHKNPVKDREDLKLEVGTLASEEEKAQHEAETLLEDFKNMRSSFGETGKVNMDLKSVAKAIGLDKEAGESQVSLERVQDSGDIGSYSEGDPLGSDLPGAMHHEKESVPTADRPEVPRNKDMRGGLIAHEDDSLKPDEPLPSIPSDKGTMGHEDEVGLSGGDHRMTGGDEGAGYVDGKEASANDELQKQAEMERDLASMKGVVGNAKQRTDSLVDRLMQAGLGNKEAGKLEAPAPVADDADVQPHSDGKGLGHEPDFKADTPENTEGSGNSSMMGHEEDSLGDVPKSPSHHPDVAEDNQLMGHEEDSDLGPEKQLKDKGTVIASGDEESSKANSASQNEAFRVAGRMLQEGMIKAADLQTKVDELSKYAPSQIKDLEKGMFSKTAEAKKGLTTASEGIEQALVISESSSHRNGQDDLTSKLQSMFTLGKQNKQAQETPDFDLRNTFR